MITESNFISNHDYYIWKNARIHYVYDKDMKGYCLYSAEGDSDDLFIPDTINGIPVTDIYGEEFYEGCNNFDKIIISKFNRQFKTVDGVLFTYDMKKMVLYPPLKRDSSYIVPKNVDTICPRAFSSNRFLKNICFQEGVKTIEMYALCWCENIDTIYFPHSIQIIKSKVFLGLDRLNRVIYHGNEEDWEKVVLSDDNSIDIKPLLQFLPN